MTLEQYEENFGKITPQGFENLLSLISLFRTKGVVDSRKIAYVLATVYHETAATFRPIAEYGRGKGRAYGKPRPNGKVYYGRGYVQITWEENYAEFKKLLGVDLVGNPELALDHEIASKICYWGMTKGKFTGRKLSDYFNDEKTDWVNARRIINGIDKATQIATHAKKFHQILES
jgi:putative chitinase